MNLFSAETRRNPYPVSQGHVVISDKRVQHDLEPLQPTLVFMAVAYEYARANLGLGHYRVLRTGWLIPQRV
jgi:hypothetical protein